MHYILTVVSHAAGGVEWYERFPLSAPNAALERLAYWRAGSGKGCYVAWAELGVVGRGWQYRRVSPVWRPRHDRHS